MKLAAIRRHPVKGIGREALERVTLSAGAPLPGDRAWALAHENAPAREGWAPKSHFLQGVRGPRLMAVEAESDGGGLILRHPDRPEARFVLPGDADALLAWVAPLWPDDQPPPARLVAAPPAGLADKREALLHVITGATLEALTEAAGQRVDGGRFRANLVLSDTLPWQEFDWIGHRLRVGEAELEIAERTGRCRATEADPATGTRDIDMLALLKRHFGHTDVGVYARVVRGGEISIGAPVELL